MCFVNLVDFDALWGHRRDVIGYGKELEQFDVLFGQLLKELNTDEIELRDGYDAVFHLVTAAKGAKECYTLENNSARSETVEQAAIADDKIIAAYTGHPHFRIIDNSTEFKTKMVRLVSEISAFLGEPEPFEIERKYLIDLTMNVLPYVLLYQYENYLINSFL